ncbi:MAG: 16S rRNA (guanine(966)-N(2))-methyltransferase RsmD [Dehalococcoidia bacterium]|nr:16S rRNA (guanine(966)-N(2))-methyltransferase RsmD [Dehalococcoidia bacterium]
MAAAKLRIAGGTARGIPLAEPRGVRLRPTSGLVREAVFNILGDTVANASVLDLYAGTGALGIEALSRGAARATFIEAEAAGCQAILQSLARTGFAAQGTVVRGRLPAALRSVEGPFDLVFMDPPYNDETAIDTLLAISGFLVADGTVVYEHGSRYNPPERPKGLVCSERRVYGDSATALYVRQEGE